MAGQPLSGRRIVVTRAKSQAEGLTRKLQGAGAEVLECPTIRFEDPADWRPVDAAIRALRDYDWVVFSSANGVERFWRRLTSQGLDGRALCDARIAAVGPATAARLERHGIVADVVPEEHVAEALVAALIEAGVSSAQVLVPRAQDGREILPEQLREAGAKVDVVAVYRTVGEENAPDGVRAALEAGEVDAVTFTSSSTVGRFAAMFAPRPVVEVLAGVAVACIGPVTAKSAEAAGLEVAVQPAGSTVPALVDALCEHFVAAARDAR